MSVLLDRLLTVGAATNARIGNVNRGGCCIYASILGFELQKRRVPYSVIVASYEGNTKGVSIDEVRLKILSNNQPSWNDHGVYFSHVALEVKIDGKNYFVDSDGVALAAPKFRENTVYKGRLRLEEAHGLANREEGWNDAFDRGHIGRMRAIVRFHMRVYDFKSQTSLSKA